MVQEKTAYYLGVPMLNLVMKLPVPYRELTSLSNSKAGF